MIKRKKLLVTLSILTFLAVFSVLNANTLYRTASTERSLTIDEHIARLEPFLEIKKPNIGEMPYPVIIIVPGCLHTISHNSAWHDLFIESGYAVVILDSFKPRGLQRTVDDLESVCLGLKVQGHNVAGDIYAVVEYLHRQDWVDKEHIAFAGWSHGGWAVMDAMAFHADSKTPSNVKGPAGVGLSGIGRIILVYPHCSFGTAVRNGFLWDDTTEVLLFVAGSDASADPQDCIDWSEDQADTARVRLVVYKDGEHTFDIPPPNNRNPSRFSEELLKKAQKEAVKFLDVNRY